MSLENSRLKPKYKPITTIASNTSDWALLKNQLYKFCPKFIFHSSLSSESFVRPLVCRFAKDTLALRRLLRQDQSIKIG